MVTTRQDARTGALGIGAIRELDRVRLTCDVVADDDVPVPMGATGTVVAIYADGEAFEVEFTTPVDALATVEGRFVSLVERHAD